MAQSRPTIPLTIIAGYLGSGKTTLLNRLIAKFDTSRFAILVNDFGKLNIDAELVELEGGKAFRLESGCICCNIGNSLMTTLLEVLRMEPRPKRVLVEASGVADPARMADISRLSPSLHQGRVIVLVDSARIRFQLADPLLAETVRKQIEASDLLVLNKVDLCSGADLADLSAWLKSEFGEPQLVTAVHSRIPLTHVLADRDAFDEPKTDGAPPNHRHGGGANIKHSAVFWSWSYETQDLYERERFEEALRELTPIVERAKGFVRFHAAPHHMFVVQLAGARYSLTAAREDQPEMPNCRIELIGTGKRPDETFLRGIFDRAREPARVSSCLTSDGTG